MKTVNELTGAQKVHLLRLWTLGCVSPKTAASRLLGASPRVLGVLVTAELVGKSAAGFWLTDEGRRRVALLNRRVARGKETLHTFL